jgi:hypothetical protein
MTVVSQGSVRELKGWRQEMNSLSRVVLVLTAGVRGSLRVVWVLGVVVFLALRTGEAQQLGHYIGGFTGLENGSTAPPGFYAAAFGLVQPIDSIKGPRGNTVLRPDIDVAGVIAAYSVVTETKILGGQYGLAFMVPVLNTRFTSDQFNASAESAGLSDILFQPVALGWAKGQGNYTINYAFYAPSGEFNPSSALNPGLGFWENQIQAGLTYNLDKKKLWNVSGLTTWEINMSKSGEDVKVGPIFTGEYSFGRRFFKYQMNAGLVGYASQKLSPDSGSGINPLVKGYLDRSFAGGGEWKYTDVKHRLAYDVRYEQQYGVQLRTSGKVMVFSVTFLDFLPPKQPAK